MPNSENAVQPLAMILSKETRGLQEFLIKGPTCSKRNLSVQKEIGKGNLIRSTNLSLLAKLLNYENHNYAVCLF